METSKKLLLPRKEKRELNKYNSMLGNNNFIFRPESERRPEFVPRILQENEALQRQVGDPERE